MELIMQELLNAGIITMEQVERARMEKIMKALEEYGIETPKITKRKDENRYICNIPKKYSKDGKRHNISGSTVEECEKKWRDEIYKFITAEPDRDATFQDIANEWLKKKRGTVNETTYALYVGMNRNHLKNTALGKMKVRDIHLSDCEDYIKSLYQKELCSTTTKQIKIMISGIMEYAVQHEYINTNYMHGVKVNAGICSTKGQRKKETWTDNELVKIKNESLKEWNEHKKYRHSAIIILQSTIGCRIGELCALNWKDIDFENKTLSITKNLVEYKDPDTNEWILTINNVKTVSGRRTIDLTDEAIFWFKEVKQRCEDKGIKSEHVVVNRNGDYIKPCQMLENFKTFCMAKKIKYKASHSNRRTYATILMDSNVPISEVSADLGHSSISTTQKFYYKRRADREQLRSQKNAVFAATLRNNDEAV